MHNRMHNPSFYMHSYSMHNSLIIQRKQTYIPALTMFIISHEIAYKLQRWSNQQHLSFNEELARNQLRHCNVPPNHRPACSSISQQRCHPWAGHDSSKDKGQRKLTHSRGTQSAKPTPLGLSGHQQNGQPAQSEDQPLHMRSKNNPFTALWRRQRWPLDNPNQPVKHSSSHKETQSCSWP